MSDNTALQPQGPIPGPGDLVSAGLELFKPNLVPMVVSMLIMGVVMIIPLVNLIAMLVLPPGLFILALRAASGKPVEIGHFFGTFKRLVPILITHVVLIVLMAVGSIVPVIGAILVGTIFQYAYYLCIDREMEFADALKGSLDIVKADPVPHLVLYLVCGLVAFVGMLLLGIGSLVTVPLALCMHAAAYHKQFGIQGGADKLVEAA